MISDTGLKILARNFSGSSSTLNLNLRASAPSRCEGQKLRKIAGSGMVKVLVTLARWLPSRIGTAPSARPAFRAAASNAEWFLFRAARLRTEPPASRNAGAVQRNQLKCCKARGPLSLVPSLALRCSLSNICRVASRNDNFSPRPQWVLPKMSSQSPIPISPPQRGEGRGEGVYSQSARVGRRLTHCSPRRPIPIEQSRG